MGAAIMRVWRGVHVTYVIAATYVAKQGKEDELLAALTEAAPLIRAEPGCVGFRAHRSVEDPRVFLLYEQFRDTAAYAEHSESDHFKELILGRALPCLESRTVVRAEPLD